MRLAALPLMILAAACVAPHDAPPAALGEPPAQASPVSLDYPQVERGSLVETQFGVAVADPYRWLEDDVRVNPKVRQWVTAQNALTEAYLAALPERAVFRKRMTELYDYERYGVPEKAGDRYFYRMNNGLQNQDVLYVREGLDGQPRMLIDPNTWSADGATALAEWHPSKDGSKLLYSVQEGGTDWRTVKVLDVATGRVLPDEVKWVN